METKYYNTHNHKIYKNNIINGFKKLISFFFYMLENVMIFKKFLQKYKYNEKTNMYI